jgi:hypothetical protein
MQTQPPQIRAATKIRHWTKRITIIGDYKSLTNAKGRTPELTRAEHKPFDMREQDNDERNAIEASG